MLDLFSIRKNKKLPKVKLLCLYYLILQFFEFVVKYFSQLQWKTHCSFCLKGGFHFDHYIYLLLIFEGGYHTRARGIVLKITLH